MFIVVIISIISLVLDGILTNFLPYMVNNLTFFTPMFTIISVFLIFPLFCDDYKKYLIYIFILGVIYDLFYTNLFVYDGIIFLLFGLITISIYKNFEVTKFRLLLYIVLFICLYEFIFAFVILLFQLVPISFSKIFYKIGHSIIINLIYGEFVYLIINLLPKKYHTKKINSFTKII